MLLPNPPRGARIIGRKGVFEPVEGGTRVTLIVKAETGGLLRIAEPLLGAILKRRLEADAAKAKDVLEARAV